MTVKIIELDALVVGAGFGGIYQLKRLRDEGFNVKLVEEELASEGLVSTLCDAGKQSLRITPLNLMSPTGTGIAIQAQESTALFRTMNFPILACTLDGRGLNVSQAHRRSAGTFVTSPTSGI